MRDTGTVILFAESEMQGKHKLTSKYTVQHRKKNCIYAYFLKIQTRNFKISLITGKRDYSNPNFILALI